MPETRVSQLSTKVITQNANANARVSQLGIAPLVSSSTTPVRITQVQAKALTEVQDTPIRLTTVNPKILAEVRDTPVRISSLRVLAITKNFAWLNIPGETGPNLTQVLTQDDVGKFRRNTAHNFLGSAVSDPVEITQGASSSFEQPSARYWRVNITQNGGSSTTSIQELQMYEAPYGPNVCFGGTPSASSELSGYGVTKAFNQSLRDVSGGYELFAFNSSVTGWIQYDFGAGNEKSIVAIGMHGRDTFITQQPTVFTVEHSDDGANWTVAWYGGAFSPWTTREYKRLVNPAVIPNPVTGSPHGAHQFWRLAFMENNNLSFSMCVGEAQFRATPGGADQATGGTAAASTEFSGSFVAANAFDNVLTTLWGSVTSSLESAFSWLRYQFPSPVEVAEVVIQARHDASAATAPRNFAVQHSDDGVTWTTAWVVIEQTGWAFSEARTFTDPNYVS